MASYVQDLVKLLKAVPNLPMHIEHNETQMLVTVVIGSQRRQSVKVSLRPIPGRLGHVVFLQSRAGVARNHQMVRSVVQANSQVRLGGLCLDTSTSPPSIDVVYSLVAENLEFDEFLLALQLVAHHADAIERRTVGSDEF